MNPPPPSVKEMQNLFAQTIKEREKIYDDIHEHYPKNKNDVHKAIAGIQTRNSVDHQEIKLKYKKQKTKRYGVKVESSLFQWLWNKCDNLKIWVISCFFIPQQLHVNHIPKDVWAKIFLYLDPKNNKSLRLVCKHFNEVTTNKHFLLRQAQNFSELHKFKGEKEFENVTELHKKIMDDRRCESNLKNPNTCTTQNIKTLQEFDLLPINIQNYMK